MGKTRDAVDYWLLRRLARRTDVRTTASPSDPAFVAGGAARLRKFNDRVQGRIPLSGGLSYLDVGCGSGAMTIALAREIGEGGTVKGVDIVPRWVEVARRRAAAASLDPSRISFDAGGWEGLAPESQFDVVLSHEAMEHFAEPFRFLQKARALLRDRRSVLVMGFGPLFHAPLNSHVDQMFRFRIPWMTLLFSENAILRLRVELRPWDRASRWEDVQGGLNRMRLNEFLRGVEEAGLATDYLVVNCQLKRWPPLWALSQGVMRLPWVRDYFAASVYGVFRRA